MLQRILIYREENGKMKQKNQWEVGFWLPKIQLGMGKTKSRISPNRENVCDLRREGEMKKKYHGKREWEISGNYFFK